MVSNYKEIHFEEHIEAHLLNYGYRTALISEAVTGKIDVREWKTVHE